MATIKMIKKDAIVKIDVGTGFIQNLQGVLMFIANQHTTDELLDFKNRANNKEPLEDWMNHLITISTLVKEIETKADQQGFVIDQESDLNVEEDLPSPPIE